jgi:hypothetical protein
MNERVKELAEKAEEVVFYSPSTGKETKELNLEKFAELIVRECLSILKESQEHYANPIKCEPAEDYVEYYIAMSAKEYAIADAISDIKYRFEVEE